MRMANLDGRAVLVLKNGGAVDLEAASGGRFGPSPQSVLDDWAAAAEWARGCEHVGPLLAIDHARLEAPSPTPGQVIAVGLNYRAHASESGFAVPEGVPPVFTKFRSSLSGPDTTVVLPPGGQTDWEAELVVVIGSVMHNVAPADVWPGVAGLCVGQDLSERVAQLSGEVPQFSLGKSHLGFAPIGPWIVTPDEFADPDDLELGCAIDDEVVQKGRTRDLIHPVPELISKISQTLVLSPGDIVFTGTPAGVGIGRNPQRFLHAGERLRSWVEGIGELHQTFVAAPAASA
ncbi:fumarylacetoacetate hydrolase family protein [Streptomyces mirabilis]|uniref:fumarylacetoacetate hydrolase family protein n=1 Tax=Streptomyces mirabilis TaxID=68239 RepID=UPI0036A80D53